MEFKSTLVHGKLIKRYKRFLADVELHDGTIVLAHCTNSGSMKSCIEEGAEVCLSQVNDPKRKTKYTWEMIKINGDWVGVNTTLPNVLVYNAIRNNEIEQLKGFTNVQREVTFADSRFDVYCENEHTQCFVEVKNVTLKEGNAVLFPDAKTIRGRKHLNTLMEVKKQGMRAVMFYVIQRMDVDYFSPAKEIDPEYTQELRRAKENGVEVFAMQAMVSPLGINLFRDIEFRF